MADNIRELIDAGEKPAWFDLREQQKLWACRGTIDDSVANDAWPFRADSIPEEAQHKGVLHAFLSAEEAEAFASIPNPHWRWDGHPARQYTLAFVMHTARRRFRGGVAVIEYIDSEWVATRFYSCDVPLPHHEREERNG